MLRKPSSLLFLILALSLLTLPTAPAAAQGTTQALTHYALLVYSTPERVSPIVGVLNPHAEVILEARSADAVWVLGHGADANVRGWIESRYLDLAPGTSMSTLLVSSEVMFVPALARSTTAYSTINLGAYPIIPINLGRARQIYEMGRIRGTDPHTVAKVGDCISDNQYFLSPFGWRKYYLANYSYLQSVIDTFSASFAQDSLVAFDGLVTSAALDPMFANPLACLPGETPLLCEYRIHKPGVAIIMFGAQDLLFTSAEQFDLNLRRIVHETIQAGVVPVLSTFPGNLKQWDQSIQYNQIVVQVALDYQIPLMNLWLALEGLPNHGLSPDGRHPSVPITEAGDLSSANLQRGYPLRNLVTLQTLDAVWRGAMY
jgi:hypothetical protein